MNVTPPFIEQVISFLEKQRPTLLILLLLGFFVANRGQAAALAHTSTSAQRPDACTYALGFDGAHETQGWGASAIIGGYQPQMWCVSVSAWSMISNSGSDGSDYAQIGYTRSAPNGYTAVNEDFIEYTYASGGDILVFLGQDTTDWGTKSNTFAVWYDSSSGYTKFTMNGVYEDSVVLDWSANEEYWDSEIHAQQDQVLGGYNHTTTFNQVQYLMNGAWHSINAQNTVSNNAPYGRYSTTTSGKFWVWDSRVA